MNSEDQSQLVKFILDNLIIEVDPLEKYIQSKDGNTTVYHIPVSVFMNFDLKEIKKHYSHFDWLWDSRWSYYKVTTESREKLINEQ